MAYRNFDEFLQSIEGLDLEEMIEDARAETKHVQAALKTRSDRVPVGGDQTEQYLEDLNGLLIWLQYGRKYPKMRSASFQKLKPICARFVSRGVMEEEALQIFQRF